MWLQDWKLENIAARNLKDDTAYIGKSIVIKGELSGNGNVRMAGQMDGPIALIEGSLTVEREGRVHGDVEARRIVLLGRVEGNLCGSDSVDLRRSAVLVGDVQTSHITIEDGASLTGSVQVRKRLAALQPKKAA